MFTFGKKLYDIENTHSLLIFLEHYFTILFFIDIYSLKKILICENQLIILYINFLMKLYNYILMK